MNFKTIFSDLKLKITMLRQETHETGPLWNIKN
jgi:hypothetical protein